VGSSLGQRKVDNEREQADVLGNRRRHVGRAR
jgi:hypothetical protein